MKTINITRTVLALAAGALVSTHALAADTAKKAAPVQQPKVEDTMFPNVKVIRATPEMIAKYNAQQTAQQSAMRAYLDPATGKLRAPTAEDGVAVSLAAAPQTAAAPAADAPAAAESQQRVLPNGAVAATPDESSVVYSVATVGKDGKLKQDCVTDKKDAKAALAAVKHEGAANEK